VSALIGFVVLYLVASIAIGLYAAGRVHGIADFAVAGRRLPLHMTIATVFATWFGAETVLGISATFLKENLRGVVADPFGASLCLVLVALFFARRLYRLNLLTIGDYFRQRYDRPVEVMLTLCIVVGYLGWTAAQITALGLVFMVLSGGAMTMAQGMVLGATIVLVYTLAGGMWSVALTDFFQMVIIVVGLAYVAWIASNQAGGLTTVFSSAHEAGKFQFLPKAEVSSVLAFMGAAVTLMLGSIPQQDTYQRVMSAKDERTAVRGSLLGGLFYLLFAFVPMYIAYSATLIDVRMVERLMSTDSQMILPTLVLEHMPLAAQIVFFGALLAAIMSSASGALLAPAVSLAENVVRVFVPRMTDTQLLWATRASVIGFALVVLVIALRSDATIFAMVENAYKVTLVTAFVPLVAGLFCSRATSAGALAALLSGLATWVSLEIVAPAGPVPPHLAGLLASAAGMLVASLASRSARRAK
jgi:Na+/proline symporter